ncbi:disulfide bond formation protein DsbA [Marinicauda salina]|uniref:2-hydroxychromene-2-carboxylate isomerase n=1 Tax=Marinicauda salina TaxID=2135793 RepID=A0A2U2BW38_9PROT|nr:DsbA family protein [Marinicauda salina]PWE18210.1 disulfide bond formation protein DsbA [Marinicauda salina]
MTLAVDLFWSFRSPYSYLATPRIRALERAWDLSVNVRPVRPLALREDDFFESRGRRWVEYLLIDVARLGEFLGVPIAPPDPDPVAIDPDTGAPAADQSRVMRLTRLGVAAAEAGRGLAFLDAASRLIWSGERWTEPGRLAAALKPEGIDLAALEAVVDSEAERVEAVIADNEAALAAAGHWGVPTLVFDGEPFFGQDRIELCLWRMKQAGLKPRNEEPRA